jgi:hypothetical protein
MLNIFKQFKLLLIDQFILSVSTGGGGGGGAPSTSTAYQTQIPEYARGYVENMLGATQNQLFKTDDQGKISGFQDYKPYSTNPADYVASFSPLQQQAQSGAANLKMPGQFGQATGMTGMAGLGSLQAGQNYANQATNPNATQAYMSPYIQNALQPQLQEMQRQYGITGTQQQAQATQQGAFGGGREAIMAAENDRNKNMAMNKAIGEGYQNAFQQAQQAQQFGADLGLRGLGQAGQAGAGLANIGGQQLAAQQGILGTQNQMGAQQQQQQQAIINQAIQNYATEQQYPMLQLGAMSNMLRGLPMSQQTVQSYQAQPTALQQGVGLLGAGATLAAATGKAEGGQIKSMRSGGIADIPAYRYGGIMSPMEFESTTQKMPDSQLQQVRGLPGITAGENIAISDAMADRQYLRSNPMASKSLSTQEAAPPPMREINPEDRMSGIAMAGGPAFDTINAASGGILSFAAGGTTPQKQYEFQDIQEGPTERMLSQVDYPEDTIEGQMARQQKYLPQEPLGKQFKDYLNKQEGVDADRLNKKELYAAARGFLKFASTPPSRGGILGAAAEGLGEYASGVEGARDAAYKAAGDREALKYNMEVAERAEKRGDFKTANDALGKVKELRNRIRVQEMQGTQQLENTALQGKNQLENTRLTIAGQKEIEGIRSATSNQAVKAAEQREALIKEDLIAEHKAKGLPPPTHSDVLRRITEVTKGHDETATTARAKIGLDSISKADAVLNGNYVYTRLINSKNPEEVKKATEMRNNLINEYREQAGLPPLKGQAPPPAQDKTGPVDTKNRLLNP